MTEPLPRPKRKNPLERTRAPVTPPAARSRATHRLTLAAAEGRFALPACTECGAVHYPARDVCPCCLGTRIGLANLAYNMRRFIWLEGKLTVAAAG